MQGVELTDLFDRYINNNCSDAEKLMVAERLANDSAFATAFNEHLKFTGLIKDSSYNAELRNRLQLISKEFRNIPAGHTMKKEDATPVYRIWQQYRYLTGIAACFLIMCAVAVYMSARRDISYERLRKDVEKVAASQNNLIRSINSKTPKSHEASFNGTGFAISTNGYVLTNYHVIKGADSVYVTNAQGQSLKVKAIYNDPVADIAILKITDTGFKKLAPLPYVLKDNNTAIGERIYTLGYPKEDLVLGEGYVSSKTGFNSDSLQYQIGVDANPGNSGAPVLDNKGRLIGIISGKEKKIEGATYAVRPKYIADAINAIPSDSLMQKISVAATGALAGKDRASQVKGLQPYVYLIKVY